MPGQPFNVSTAFSSGNNSSYQGSTIVNAPASGNNPQNIDQLVSAALAAATPGQNSGDQKIVATEFASSDIGYSATPNDNNGGGYGFKANLVSAGSGSGAQQVVIKFINAATGNPTVVSYTLGPGQVVAFDAIGASAQLGNVTIKEIDCTPSPDGSVFEILGILNLNV